MVKIVSFQSIVPKHGTSAGNKIQENDYCIFSNTRQQFSPLELGPVVFMKYILNFGYGPCHRLHSYFLDGHQLLNY